MGAVLLVAQPIDFGQVCMRWDLLAKVALGAIVVLLALAYAVGSKVDRDRIEREQAYQFEEARRLRMYELCKSAIARAVGESVVHWGAEGDLSMTGYGGRRILSNSEKWFSRTSEGYSVSLYAGTGANVIDFSCYLGKDERTITKIIRR